MKKAKKYKIKWVINAVRLGKRGKRSISLGFCEKTKKVAFASVLGSDALEGAKPFIVHDVYVDDECEDGQLCWNLQCPYNKATRQTLKKYLGKKCSSEEFKTVSVKLQEFGKHFISDIDWNEEGQIVYKKPAMFVSSKREKTK